MLSTQYQFSFYKKSPMWTPPVLTALSAPCVGPLGPPRRGVPVGSGLPGSPPYHLDRTIRSIHTPCSLSICLLLLLTTAQECLTAGRIKAATGLCVQVCSSVCVSKGEKIPFPREVCIYNINTPLHMSTCVTFLLTIYICPREYLSCGCDTTYMLTFIW